MGGSKSEEFLASSDVGEDTYVRCTTCDYAANVEAVAGARRPQPVAVRRRARRARRADAGHPDDRRPWSTTSTRSYPRDDRPWHAGDTLKNVLVVLKHADGTREPLAIGLPGDRDVDQKRLEGMLEPTEVEPMDEAELAEHPALVKGYIGPGALGEESRSRASATCVDPRVVEGTRWVTGADVHGSHVLDLVAGRDFTGDGTIEAAEVRDGDPCPQLRGRGARWRPRAASRWATSSSSAASTPRRSTSRCSTRTASWSPSRWAPTASASRAPCPSIAEDNHDELGLVWPREVAPADVHIVATGKDAGRLRGGRQRSPTSSRPPGSRCSTTTGPKVSPGVKFKDAELIGVPTIVTVGRGLADGNVEVKDRRTGERTEVAVGEAVDAPGRRRPRLASLRPGSRASPVAGRADPDREVWCGRRAAAYGRSPLGTEAP